MLEAKGCDMTLTNSSQKTGKKLADAFWRELELSCVHPWSRGDQLHLVATNLESFLSVAEYDLNEHVHSGMQVWNSKQMVWKFDKEQMQALQAAVKQLVCTCTRAYAHSPRRMLAYASLTHAHKHAHPPEHPSICACAHPCVRMRTHASTSSVHIGTERL